MIIHAVSAQVAAGQWQQAIEWTMDMNAYCESKGWAVPRVFQPQYGDQVNQMVWTWEFDSLAAFEQWNDQVFSDEGVQQRLKSAAGVFSHNYIQAYKQVL